MSGGIGSLLDVSRRALFAQTQAIRTIGSNIANVNTPGYSRRSAELVALQPASLGSDGSAGTGVEVSQIVRKVDEFLNREYMTRINDRSKSEIRDEILGRAEAPFALADNEGSIGHSLSDFFSALEDLALNPADIPLRNRVIEAGASLVGSVRSGAQLLADLQRESDSRIGTLVTEVNRIAGNIAELNEQISASETGDQANLTLRDQRDKSLRELSELVNINVIENSDGTQMVSLDNGFGLVVGTSVNALEFVNNPSYAPVGGFQTGLDGNSLGHVVFNFGTTTVRSDIDLTGVFATGSGSISGLLNVRGVQSATDTSPFDAQGDLVELGSRVEAIARDLLTRFNLSYLGPDENAGLAGLQPSSGDLTGTPPGVYGMFSITGLVDTDADGQPDDLNNSSTYARQLQFAISDPAALAAALDLDPAAGSTAFAQGDGRNAEALAALRTTPTTYTVGNFSSTSTIEELYQTTVARAGGLKANAANSAKISKDRETQVSELVASISGVSLDEEFANLINFQRAFEASARMIRTGDELLGEILELVG